MAHEIRTDMESRFGASFSAVRIHSGGAAAASAADLHAHAYTVGNEIVLGAGSENLASADGRHTLAHELTHVLQQRNGAVDGTPIAGGISVSDPGDSFERAAEVTADSVLSRTSGLPRSPGLGLLALQQSAGNRATSAVLTADSSELNVQRCAGEQHPGAVGRLLSVQRCGNTPPEECGCHADGTADGEAPSVEKSGEQDLMWSTALQRSDTSSETPIVQRHQGSRVKQVLQTELLATEELHTAASSSDQALESARSGGDAVGRLQEALNIAGFDVAFTSVFDAQTQRAVARFQAAHGIPFPTGRQAGPKTLSTLDDHLLGALPPKPPTGCNSYLPGEREASITTPGTFEHTGGLGQILRLTNFGAGRGRMKPEHDVVIATFVKEFGLFEPDAAFEVEFVRGFTDAVDSESENAVLREERAIDAEFILKSNGVPSPPEGEAAAEGSFDAGCDPAGHTAARAVVIQLRKKIIKPAPPKSQLKAFPGCGAPLNARLEAAIPGAVSNLNTAIGQLNSRPLSTQARDALFVYFRQDDDAIATQVAAQLGKAARGLAKDPPIDCNALLGCDPGTHAVTNLITGFIHICNEGALDPDQVNLERTLMHEGMHLFAGFSAVGEMSHGDAPGCDESDLAGQMTGARLANADSFAAFAVRVAKSPVSGIHRSSEHFHGNDIALATQPKGTTNIRLADDVESFRAIVHGFEDLNLTTQWRLTDGAGRHYLLLNTENEVIFPDQVSNSILIKIGRKTRDLLAARGVSDATLSIHVRNQVGVNRAVSLVLTFIR